MNVLVAGLGKLGSVMAALIADQGNNVVGVDPMPDTVRAINEGRAPVDEPGLEWMMANLTVGREVEAGSLRATSDYGDAVRYTDAAFVVVPTPSMATGEFDPSMVLDAVNAIVDRIAVTPRPEPYLIIVASTVSPGTMESVIVPAIQEKGFVVGENILLAYSPEFIALGTVIDNLRTPDMILLGAMDHRSAGAAAGLSLSFRNPAPISSMSFPEAEITKLAINVYLSVKINFANMIGAAVHLLGGRPEIVLEAIGRDKRISPYYLRMGGPPAGPCLPRDLVAMERFGQMHETPMRLATAARELSRDIVLDLCQCANMGPARPTVALLGVAYKPGSPVTDASLGRDIIRQASMQGADIVAYDPHARIPASFPFQFRAADTLDEALRDASAVIIGCPHPEFAGIEYPAHLTIIDPWG